MKIHQALQIVYTGKYCVLKIYQKIYTSTTTITTTTITTPTTTTTTTTFNNSNNNNNNLYSKRVTQSNGKDLPWGPLACLQVARRPQGYKVVE